MQRAVVLLIVALHSSACAFTNIPLTLPTQALEDTIPGGNGRELVVVVPFSDERAIRDRCGMQKNGYNMDTADAVCQSDPNAWLGQLLADELRATGFTVLPASDPQGADTVRVEGSLLKLFVEPVQGTWTGSLEADVSVKLHVTSASGLDAERTFFVKGWKGGQIASTMQPYHTALHRATQDLLAQMVHAIVELLDRYPQVGMQVVPTLVVRGEAGDLAR